VRERKKGGGEFLQNGGSERKRSDKEIERKIENLRRKMKIREKNYFSFSLPLPLPPKISNLLFKRINLLKKITVVKVSLRNKLGHAHLSVYD
jgi:hypothetical protein